MVRFIYASLLEYTIFCFSAVKNNQNIIQLHTKVFNLQVQFQSRKYFKKTICFQSDLTNFLCMNRALNPISSVYLKPKALRLGGFSIKALELWTIVTNTRVHQFGLSANTTCSVLQQCINLCKFEHMILAKRNELTSCLSSAAPSPSS